VHSVNGHLVQLSTKGQSIPAIGSVVQVRYQEHNEDSTPAFVSFRWSRPDLTWEMVCNSKSVIQYKMATGKQSPLPKCRGCKRQIPKAELRVQTSVTFKPPGSGPYQGNLSFCVNTTCIEMAIREYAARGFALPYVFPSDLVCLLL
jgi:hypothetical protein